MHDYIYATWEEYNQMSYLERLEEWCRWAQDALALGVALMPSDQLARWENVRTVQETCPVAYIPLPIKVLNKDACDDF